MAPQRAIRWTNDSVLRLAGNADPISVIEAKARDLVLRAKDAGWTGPPYNPFAIAELLKIPVEANVDVADARTVPCEGGVRIQFNPTQIRERVRFSLAHEIAHTLFPDVTEKVRNRGRVHDTPDDWQLEMLCNLAASEFVMPLGSLLPSDDLPPLEQLLIDRRKFDVSVEAYLIRIAKTTSLPVLVFCASPRVSEGRLKEYRIDYAVGSKSSPVPTIFGKSIPKD